MTTKFADIDIIYNIEAKRNASRTASRNASLNASQTTSPTASPAASPRPGKRIVTSSTIITEDVDNKRLIHVDSVTCNTTPTQVLNTPRARQARNEIKPAEGSAFADPRTEIKKMLRDCIVVPKSMYDIIPKWSQIHYIDNKLQFHVGGFVFSNDSSMFTLVSKQYGKPNTDDCTSYVIGFSDIKTLYKKHASGAIIEITLIREELSKRSSEVSDLRRELFIASEQRDELVARIEKLEAGYTKLKEHIKRTQSNGTIPK
jgi:hypothetical protein